MRVLMLAGEASGDVHAAKVATVLRRAGAEIVAVGGPALQAAGAELVAHIDDIAVLGFVEVLARLPRFVALHRRLERLLRRRRFDLFLPVDYPGFNLRFAARAHALGVPVLYYVGPQVWAWRAGRLDTLRRVARHVALILPFEKALYDAAGVPASFVGHPLLDDAEPQSAGGQAIDLGLFPGSRPQEVRRHLPILLQAAASLRSRRPGLRIVVSQASTAPVASMRDTLRDYGFDPERDLSREPARRLMPRARALFVASGTATLEAALAERPFAVVYRTGRINYAMARRLVRVPHVSLVNLVAGEAIVREFVQDALRPESLVAEAERLLDDVAEQQRIVHGLRRVRQQLGAPGASERVARLALSVAARDEASLAAAR